MIQFISGNGTSRQRLIDDRVRAIRAFNEALDRLRDTAPHGRDYVGNEGQYELDRDAFRERYRLVDKIVEQLQAEALAIRDLPGRP